MNFRWEDFSSHSHSSIRLTPPGVKVRPSTTFLLLMISSFLISSCNRPPDTISRPEEIVSMRQVCYDQATYQELATAWREYYQVFPSEESYANWMYAARYAGKENYQELLEKGVLKYPANPTLLYLYSMSFHGKELQDAKQYLERAIGLAPEYSDPWFSLVINYLEDGQPEQVNLALAKLLELNAIQDVVMDYNYNVLALLPPDAILVTNGDNDTYPGWVLQRVLGIRPDVAIVNRSLLNTTWYFKQLIQDGLIRFMDLTELETIREQTPPPWSDTLIVRLVEAAAVKGYPVYFAHTLYGSPQLEPLLKAGGDIGLCTRVTPPKKNREQELQEMTEVWLTGFRSGSLQSWGLQYARRSQSPRWLATNYAYGLVNLLEELQRYNPEQLPGLFTWYRLWALPLLELEQAEQLNNLWCQLLEDEAGCDWCREQGLLP